MPQIVFAAAPDGAVDYYNERWYEYTGQPRDGTGDQSWAPIIHPDDLPALLAASVFAGAFPDCFVEGTSPR